MTTNTPAPAQEARLTDDEIRDIITDAHQAYGAFKTGYVIALGRAIESALLSKLRAPKPLGDACHHCGWLDWVSHDGAAYCQACGKPHGSVPKEGLPNLPDLLRENADLDEAEGENAHGCSLERDAADEIERLRREVAKLRAPVADERAAITNEVGFEFAPGELQSCNADDLLRIYRAGYNAALASAHVHKTAPMDVSPGHSAPVADERDRNATVRQVVEMCKGVPPIYVWTAATYMYDKMQRRAALASNPLAGEAQPVAWFIDWPDEPELGHYIAESPAANGRSRPLVFADAVPQPSEPVYAYRRKGLNDFVTCDRERFDELNAKPRLFETRIFYAAPQASEAVGIEAAFAGLDRIVAVRDAALEEAATFLERNRSTWVSTRAAYEIRALKSQSAALSAQPGAQRTGGSDAE